LSEKTRNIVIVSLGLVALGVVARIFYPTGDPAVEVRAEDLFYLFTNTPGEGLGFTNSMLLTVVIDIVLIVLAIAATASMNLVPRGLQNTMEAIIEALYNLFRGINPDHVGRVFPIVATIFLFVLFSNYSGLLPGFGSIGLCEYPQEEHASHALQFASGAPVEGMLTPQLMAEEGKSSYWGCQPGQHIIPIFRAPSADLSFTIALALVAWFTIQFVAFRALGLGYLKKYFISPVGKLSEGKGPLMTVVGILELISLFARLPAFAFRLFGNIFAGEVLIIVMLFLLPLGLPIPMYLFEVFVGFIQAFIFAVLTMAFISVDATPHAEEH
jgi:F-type H+-transporting ATPase subunit a